MPENIEQAERQDNQLEDIPAGALQYVNTPKLVKDFVVIDFETTGFSHVENEIIQMAAVRYIDFVETEKFVTYVKPVQSIPAKITAINGITNADVRNAPSIKEALGKLLQFIGDDVLVAHNASFDMKFLLANMYKQQLAYKRFKAIDTVALAREYMETPNHKLPTLKEFLGLGHFNSHEALHDCYVAGEVYRYCYGERMVESV